MATPAPGWIERSTVYSFLNLLLSFRIKSRTDTPVKSCKRAVQPFRYNRIKPATSPNAMTLAAQIVAIQARPFPEGKLVLHQWYP